MSGLNSYWGYFKRSSLSRVTSAVQRESCGFAAAPGVDTHSLAGKLVGLGQVIVITAHRRGQRPRLCHFFFLVPGRFLLKVGRKPFTVIFQYTCFVNSSSVACQRSRSCVIQVVCFCSDCGNNSGTQGGFVCLVTPAAK